MDGGYRIESTVVDTPAVTAWMVSSGEIGGVDISGRTVVVVRPGPVVVLDERATPQQAEAVRAVFTDREAGFYLAPLRVRSRRLTFSIRERRVDCRLTLPG